MKSKASILFSTCAGFFSFFAPKSGGRYVTYPSAFYGFCIAFDSSAFCLIYAAVTSGVSIIG